MAEEARRRAGKGTGQGGSESSHPFKGKGKGPGENPAEGRQRQEWTRWWSCHTVRSEVRPPPGSRVPALYSWKARGPTACVPQRMVERNNMRSDSALRAELRERMRAAHHAPRASTQPAAPQTGESVSTTPRQPPPPPRGRARRVGLLLRRGA